MLYCMNKPVTARQKELLSIIYEHIRDTGFPPSFEEMRERLRVSSNQSILDLLEKLQRGGYIKRKESGARNLAVLPLGYKALGAPALTPFMGVTSAGEQVEAIPISGEWRAVSHCSEKVERLQEDIFILRISGDSMINAGIDDGDTVLVQTKKEFVSGEIVYAQIGSEGTIKRFVSDDKPPYVFLKPENPKYKNILCTDEVELKGKVISVLKSDYWKAIK